MDFTEGNCSEVRFIALVVEQLGVETLSLKEQTPHFDFLGVDKYVYLDNKLNVDFGPQWRLGLLI